MEDAFQTAAQWYDGTNAVRHSGTLSWDGRGAFTLAGPEARDEFDAADLRFVVSAFCQPLADLLASRCGRQHRTKG